MATRKHSPVADGNARGNDAMVVASLNPPLHAPPFVLAVTCSKLESTEEEVVRKMQDTEQAAAVKLAATKLIRSTEAARSAAICPQQAAADHMQQLARCPESGAVIPPPSIPHNHKLVFNQPFMLEVDEFRRTGKLVYKSRGGSKIYRTEDLKNWVFWKSLNKQVGFRSMNDGAVLPPLAGWGDEGGNGHILSVHFALEFDRENTAKGYWEGGWFTGTIWHSDSQRLYFHLLDRALEGFRGDSSGVPEIVALRDAIEDADQFAASEEQCLRLAAARELLIPPIFAKLEAVLALPLPSKQQQKEWQNKRRERRKNKKGNDNDNDNDNDSDSDSDSDSEERTIFGNVDVLRRAVNVASSIIDMQGVTHPLRESYRSATERLEEAWQTKLAPSVNAGDARPVWTDLTDDELADVFSYFLGKRHDWAAILHHSAGFPGGVEGLQEAMMALRGEEEIHDTISAAVQEAVAHHQQEVAPYGKQRGLFIVWRCLRDGAPMHPGTHIAHRYGSKHFLPKVPVLRRKSSAKDFSTDASAGAGTDETKTTSTSTSLSLSCSRSLSLSRSQSAVGGSAILNEVGSGGSGGLVDWSRERLADYLESQGQERLAELCYEHHVSGAVLELMHGHAELERIGVETLRERKRSWAVVEMLKKHSEDRLLSGGEHLPVPDGVPMALDAWNATEVQQWAGGLAILKDDRQRRQAVELLGDGLRGWQLREFITPPSAAQQEELSRTWSMWKRLSTGDRATQKYMVRAHLVLRHTRHADKEPLRGLKNTAPLIRNLASAIRALIVGQLLLELREAKFQLEDAGKGDPDYEARCLRVEILTAAMITPGTRLLRLHAERAVGKGAFGTVWLVRDCVDGSEAVLKFVTVSIDMTDGDALTGELERLKDEQSAMEAARSPFVVDTVMPPVFSLKHEPRRCYFVLPFYDGGDMKTRIARCSGSGGAPIPSADLARWTGQLLSALCVLYRAYLVHRDLKPENIFLHAGRALVGDLGLAKSVEDKDAPGESVKLTMFAGTLGYAAPEQRETYKRDGGGKGKGKGKGKGEKKAPTSDGAAGYGCAVDVFSMGLVIFEMCVGRAIGCPADFIGEEKLEQRLGEVSAAGRSQRLVHLLRGMLQDDPGRRQLPGELLREYDNVQFADLMDGVVDEAQRARLLETRTAKTMLEARKKEEEATGGGLNHDDVVELAREVESLRRQLAGALQRAEDAESKLAEANLDLLHQQNLRIRASETRAAACAGDHQPANGDGAAADAGQQQRRRK